MTKTKPLVGILSGTHQKKAFSGDHHYFRNILQAVERRGEKAFVFTPAGIHEHSIDGVSFHTGAWMKHTFPYPRLVYNRLPTKRSEETNQMKHFFAKLDTLSIPYFNLTFLNKWETYLHLSKNASLRQQLPETMLVTDEHEAFKFLKKYKKVYAKPVYGKTGSGIFTLTWKNKHEFRLTTHHETKSISRQTLAHLLSDIQKHENLYIFQQAVSLDEFNGKKYDFRILLLKPKSTWEVIGIGVRLANKHGITTHVRRGGSLLQLHELQPQINHSNLSLFAQQIARELNKSYPLLKECSLDIGQDKFGHLWVFEVNTKPMSFDETEIEEKRMQTLTELFIHHAKQW